MTTLLAMSFDAPASPSITLRPNDELSGPRRHHFGWGVAWYPDEDRSAAIIKDPTTIQDNAMTHLLRDWPRFRATVFVCHVRGAAKRISQDDTHPFARPWGGRDWTLTHNGYLRAGYQDTLWLAPDQEQPIGHTDTEHMLCWLIQQLRMSGARRLIDVGWEQLSGWLATLNSLGSANLLLSDGDVLIAYQDESGYNPLHWRRLVPPHATLTHASEDVELTLGGALDVNRTAVIVSTQPMGQAGWHRLSPGGMIAIRRGAVIWERGERLEATPHAPWAPGPPPAATAQAPGPMVVLHREQELLTHTGALYLVTHDTRYDYTTPVELSHHALRLRPVHDSAQRLLRHQVRVQPQGAWEAFEDVFGNYALHLEQEAAFDALHLRAVSLVRVLPETLGALQSRARRTSIPIDWMPWQRQMMLPYLLPPELPESQLRELFDFAMSFVARQDYDLVETFLDMNQTIQRDFAYVQGVTTLETTAFDVYVQRQGVCQDFANLLICLARLLGVPARYRVGYIHTGADYMNQAQSEASHAWVELYLPWSGWRGFDPTNACRAGLDHIRVACGRTFNDATPTSGTIYRGGGGERLEVTVRVEPVDDLDAGLARFDGAW